MGMHSNVKNDVKSAQLVLESLKRDHEQALSALNTFCNSENVISKSKPLAPDSDKIFNEEKIPLIQTALKHIEKGLDDSEVIITFAKYTEYLEAEITKFQLHNQRLIEETGWLRDELRYTQIKLEETESALAQAEVEKRHLEFLLELRKYETQTNFDTSNLQNEIESNTDAHTNQNVNQPTMIKSAFGLPTLSSNNLYCGQNGFRRPSAAVLSSLTTSHHLELSGILQNSLLETDFDSLPYSRQSQLGVSGFTDTDPRNCVPPGLRTLHHIVLRYTNQGKHDVAASLCLQTIRDLETAAGHDQAEVAVLLNILALVYRDQGKYEDASVLLKEVIDIREKVFGPNHLLVAAALNNLAVLYAKCDRFSDAEPLCRRALQIRQKLLGPYHLDVAKQLNNLALLCQSQGRFDEVESLFRQALDIYIRHHRPSSPIVRKAKNNLASALLKRQNLMDAESLLKSILTPCPPQQTKLPNRTDSFEIDSAMCSVTSSPSTSRMRDNCTNEQFMSPNHLSSSDILQTIHTNNHHQLLLPNPLWLMVEQTIKSGQKHQIKMSVIKWAAQARIELSVAQSAARNLAIVYQRQGMHEHANLLLCWLQATSTTGTPTMKSNCLNKITQSVT